MVLAILERPTLNWVCKLLTYCTHPTVAQVVDIIDSRFRIYKLYEILDDLSDIFLSEDSQIRISVEIELLVQTISTYYTEIVSLFREEQLIDWHPSL